MQYFIALFANLGMHAYCLLIVFSGIMRLDARARQDVAIIGSGFLKLDGNFFYLLC